MICWLLSFSVTVCDVASIAISFDSQLFGASAKSDNR
jgi:hypothetical protein